jgi:hypothetical protein
VLLEVGSVSFLLPNVASLATFLVDNDFYLTLGAEFEIVTPMLEELLSALSFGRLVWRAELPTLAL